jgi:TatD DNase family protein
MSNQPELIDIGVNLDHASFEQDREQVIERAEAAGVSGMVLTGTSIKSSQGVLKLAQAYPGQLYATAGVHPHNARQCNTQTIQDLRKLAAHSEVVAIGECGLDFNRDFSPRPVQERWFEEQVALACELKMPLFLHERDAHQRFSEILATYRSRFEFAVVHCFTGTRQELQKYLEMDLYIGITGWICDERRGLHLRELVRYIPLDRLMLETDAPFLTPRDLKIKPREGRNEPAFLPHIMRTVATCMSKSPNQVAHSTTKTARKFFNLPTITVND